MTKGTRGKSSRLVSGQVGGSEGAAGPRGVSVLADRSRKAATGVGSPHASDLAHPTPAPEARVIPFRARAAPTRNPEERTVVRRVALQRALAATTERLEYLADTERRVGGQVALIGPSEEEAAELDELADLREANGEIRRALIEPYRPTLRWSGPGGLEERLTALDAETMLGASVVAGADHAARRALADAITLGYRLAHRDLLGGDPDA